MKMPEVEQKRAKISLAGQIGLLAFVSKYEPEVLSNWNKLEECHQANTTVIYCQARSNELIHLQKDFQQYKQKDTG